MQQYLIIPKDVSVLSRDMSNHIDEDRINTYIRESEDIDIKSALGGALFLDLKEHPEKYELLLNGGTYTDRCGEIHSFSGLKRALAYYTYARLVKNADGNLTRFGFVEKGNEYSNNAEFKKQLMAYNDAFSIADAYLKECVMFLTENKKDYPLYKGNGGIKAKRTTYRIIGE